MQAEDHSPKANPAWKIALVAVPVFLVLSSAWAMWIWWKRSQNTDPDPRLALAASEVQEAELADHLHKLTQLIGARDWTTPEGRQAMRRAIAFIEGTLSPQNYGFRVESGGSRPLGEELWPTIWADLRGTAGQGEVVIVAAPYDRLETQIAAVLGAANDLRDEELRKTVRFVFFPAELYPGGEGLELETVVREDESLSDFLVPRIPEREGPLTASEVVPIARRLVEEVRKSAR